MQNKMPRRGHSSQLSHGNLFYSETNNLADSRFCERIDYHHVKLHEASVPCALLAVHTRCIHTNTNTHTHTHTHTHTYQQLSSNNLHVSLPSSCTLYCATLQPNMKIIEFIAQFNRKSVETKYKIILKMFQEKCLKNKIPL
jgi:hypothetical protein